MNIAINFTPTEFDLVLEALENHLSYLSQCADDTDLQQRVTLTGVYVKLRESANKNAALKNRLLRAKASISEPSHERTQHDLKAAVEALIASEKTPRAAKPAAEGRIGGGGPTMEHVEVLKQLFVDPTR